MLRTPPARLPDGRCLTRARASLPGRAGVRHICSRSRLRSARNLHLFARPLPRHRTTGDAKHSHNTYNERDTLHHRAIELNTHPVQ